MSSEVIVGIFRKVTIARSARLLCARLYHCVDSRLLVSRSLSGINAKIDSYILSYYSVDGVASNRHLRPSLSIQSRSVFCRAAVRKGILLSPRGEMQIGASPTKAFDRRA